MTTTINRFGQEYTNWKSHKHPENPKFMQVVFWNVWVSKEGQTTIVWNLGNGSQSNYIYNMTKEEAIAKFTDEPTVELTEDDYQQWLKKNSVSL